MKHYTDHPDYRNFIRAICAEPENDMPRLVLADWLDEQGDTEAAKRAEFIRAQIENDDVIITVGDQEEAEAGRRQELLRNRENTWFAIPERIAYTVHRGFVSTVRCTLAQFDQHAGRIATEHPVTKWLLTDRSNPFDLGVNGWYFPLSYPPAHAVGTHLYAETVHCFYQTRESAIEGLQRACYVVARQRAESLETPE